ncbi:MAG: hypothetical protein K0S01_2174 [Herbinix sp.]|jgi:hypothetical protein|nr:hypothetical protein [Herbinix sp.]
MEEVFRIELIWINMSFFRFQTCCKDNVIIQRIPIMILVRLILSVHYELMG